MTVHSGNAGAVRRMEEAIESIRRLAAGRPSRVNADHGAKLVDFLWLLLPLALLAGFRKRAEPAGLAVGFAFRSSVRSSAG